MEDCEHNFGFYICDETGYHRCNACDSVTNVSKEEFCRDDDDFFN